MNNKVSVVKCDRYSEVQNAVENAVSLIGGIGKFVKKGDNVVIKQIGRASCRERV